MAAYRQTVAVVGSLNVDLVSLVSHVPAAGETISAQAFTTNCGGKGANQAVALARLAGHHTVTQMVGAVGNDAFGQKLKGELDQLGVDISNVKTVADTASGVAVIVVEQDTGENRIIISPGANGTVLPNTLPAQLFVPETQPNLILLQLEIPPETVLEVIKRASECLPCIPVLLNPTPALELPHSLYPLVDYLVVNETEASMLTGVDFPSLNDPHSQDDLASQFELRAFESIDWFIDKGAKNVIVTLGGLGAAFYEASSSTKMRVPAVKVKVIDTTAAGDTFIGALASKLVPNLPGQVSLEEIVKFAVLASAWTVGRRGTWEAMPTLDDLQSLTG